MANETSPLMEALGELLQLLAPEQQSAVIKCVAHGAAFIEGVKAQQPLRRIQIPDMRKR